MFFYSWLTGEFQVSKEYPSNSLFTPIWPQVTDSLCLFHNYIFKALIIQIG